MSVVVEITHFKGGDPEKMIEAARYAVPRWKGLGAEYAQPFRVHSGPDAGQWVFVVRFPSWSVYGQAREAIATDAEFQRRLAELLTQCELVSRVVNVGVDL
jgi:hypothetical protein